MCGMAFAGTRDPNTPDEKYIEFGKKFYCVGKLIIHPHNEEGRYVGSCVIIDKHHALTSAHMSSGQKEDISLWIDDKTYRIDSMKICPVYHFDHYADIALLYCEKGFHLDKFPSIYTDHDELGKQCTFAGYGFTGTFETGYIIKHESIRRAGSNQIGSVDQYRMYCSPSKRTDKTFTPLEFMISPKDSGGGCFIDGKLAGINCCIRNETMDIDPMAKYGDESGFVRVSKFVDWIERNKTKRLTD